MQVNTYNEGELNPYLELEKLLSNVKQTKIKTEQDYLKASQFIRKANEVFNRAINALFLIYSPAMEKEIKQIEEVHEKIITAIFINIKRYSHAAPFSTSSLEFRLLQKEFSSEDPETALNGYYLKNSANSFLKNMQGMVPNDLRRFVNENPEALALLYEEISSDAIKLTFAEIPYFIMCFDYLDAEYYLPSLEKTIENIFPKTCASIRKSISENSYTTLFLYCSPLSYYLLLKADGNFIKKVIERNPEIKKDMLLTSAPFLALFTEKVGKDVVKPLLENCNLGDLMQFLSWKPNLYRAHRAMLGRQLV